MEDEATEREAQTTSESEVQIPEVMPMEGETPLGQKAKGVAQMAAGTVLTAAGVPMLILPGPGAAAIAGGAILLSKGDRNFTGRAAIPAEKAFDTVAEKAAGAAKTAAGKAVRSAADGAAVAIPAVAKGVAHGAKAAAKGAAKVAKPAARGAAKLAGKGIRGAVHIGGSAAKAGVQALKKARH